jgi:hypothetical protein
MLAKYAKYIEAAAQLVSFDKFAEIATEPAKKEHLIRHALMPDPVKKPDKHTSPAAHLRAEMRIVPFDYRANEFEDFCQWCASEEPFAWRLVHGDSGRGKSRLLIELCVHHNGHKTGTHWIAGFINVDMFREDQTAFELLFETNKPLLIVLDYAERQSEIVTQLLKRSYERSRNHPDRITRIVLISRRSTDVWDKIFREDNVLHSLNRSLLAEFHLKPVMTGTDVKAVFSDGFNAFSRHFATAPTMPEFDFSTLTSKGQTLDIGLVHMLALLAVKAPDELNWQTNARPTQDELLQFMLHREIRFWQKTAHDLGLPPELRTQEVLAEAAALLTFAAQQGAIVDAPQARRVLRGGTLLKDQTEARLDLIASVFRQTYPGPGYANGVAPDLLGDFLIQQQWD